MRNSRTGIKSLIALVVAAPILLGLSACSGEPVHYFQPSDFATSATGSVTPITPQPQPTSSTATIVPQGVKASASKAAEAIKAKAEQLAKALKEKAQQAQASKSPTVSTGETGGKAKALIQLAGLKVQEADYSVKYNRTKDFGPAWYDYDHNGCDTRNDVLKRTLHNIVYKYGNCIVASGTYTDPYTNTVKHFVRGERTSADTQVDHLAPLGWVIRHGAANWTYQQRLAYANDYKNVLLAVDGSQNGQKSDSGPADWMPENGAYACTYVEKFTNILSIYKLTIDRRDAAKIRSVLSTCK